MIKQQAELSAIEQGDLTRLEKIVRDHIVEGLGDLPKLRQLCYGEKPTKHSMRIALSGLNLAATS